MAGRKWGGHGIPFQNERPGSWPALQDTQSLSPPTKDRDLCPSFLPHILRSSSQLCPAAQAPLTALPLAWPLGLDCPAHQGRPTESLLPVGPSLSSRGQLGATQSSLRPNVSFSILCPSLPLCPEGAREYQRAGSALSAHAGPITLLTALLPPPPPRRPRGLDKGLFALFFCQGPNRGHCRFRRTFGL